MRKADLIPLALELHQLFRAGRSVPELSQTYGLSEESIWIRLYAAAELLNEASPEPAKNIVLSALRAQRLLSLN